MNFSEIIKQYAFKLGFDLVGFTTADSFERGEQMLQQWLKNYYAGKMDYMKINPKRRARPQQILPEAKSIISLAMNYYQPDKLDNNYKIAKYARGMDYHHIIKNKLIELDNYIKKYFTEQPVLSKIYVDTGPLLEREIAERAGLGFIGKNTNLITRQFGSWVFLSEILINIELDYDRPAEGTCGTCTLCIDACPTGAIVDAYKLDSNKCISYLTIELRDVIPESLRPLLNNWLFGCDICQDVCPFNHNSILTKNSDLLNKKTENILSDLKHLLSLQEDKNFKELFNHSPLIRPKREGLIRNAIINIANSKQKSYLSLLKVISEADSAELVQAHAHWAINQLSPK